MKKKKKKSLDQVFEGFNVGTSWCVICGVTLREQETSIMKRIESDYTKTKHGVNVGPLGPSGVKRMYWMLENIRTVAGTSTPGVRAEESVLSTQMCYSLPFLFNQVEENILRRRRRSRKLAREEEEEERGESVSLVSWKHFLSDFESIFPIFFLLTSSPPTAHFPKQRELPAFLKRTLLFFPSHRM